MFLGCARPSSSSFCLVDFAPLLVLPPTLSYIAATNSSSCRTAPFLCARASVATRGRKRRPSWSSRLDPTRGPSRLAEHERQPDRVVTAAAPRPPWAAPAERGLLDQLAAVLIISPFALARRHDEPEPRQHSTAHSHTTCESWLGLDPLVGVWLWRCRLVLVVLVVLDSPTRRGPHLGDGCRRRAAGAGEGAREDTGMGYRAPATTERGRAVRRLGCGVRGGRRRRDGLARRDHPVAGAFLPFATPRWAGQAGNVPPGPFPTAHLVFAGDPSGLTLPRAALQAGHDQLDPSGPLLVISGSRIPPPAHISHAKLLVKLRRRLEMFARAGPYTVVRPLPACLLAPRVSRIASLTRIGRTCAGPTRQPGSSCSDDRQPRFRLPFGRSPRAQERPPCLHRWRRLVDQGAFGLALSGPARA